MYGVIVLKCYILAFFSTKIVDIKAAGEYVLTVSDVTYSDNGDGTMTITDFVNPTEKNIAIPNIIDGKTVKIIGDYAYYRNDLTNVVIPDSVITIGDYAFRGNDLTSIVIPDSVTKIGNYAFYRNDLASVVLPDSVTSIGLKVFNSNSITVFNGLPSDGIIYARNEDGTEDYTTIVSYGGISNVVDFIPDSVTTIEKSAFYNNNLTSIVIPNSVTTIRDYAFRSNDLTSVVIPNSVTTIEKSAFYNNNLTSIVIPNSVTTIRDYAFRSNDLTSVVIPNSVTTIGKSAFRSNSLTSVVIPDSVITIEDSVFKDNNLSSVVIPDSVIMIEDSAFANNLGLHQIVLPVSDGELWVEGNGDIVSEIIDLENNFTKKTIRFAVYESEIDIELGSNYELPSFKAYLVELSGKTVDVSDSVLTAIFGNVNINMPGTYELVYRLQYEGYTEEHKVEVRVIDTRPPRYYRLQDQLIYIDTDLDWTKLVGRIWSSSDVSINVVDNVNIKDVGENELKITVKDNYDNKINNNLIVKVSNNRDDFTKLTYRLNNNKSMEYDIKKQVGYYDHYKLSIEYLSNNVDFKNVGNYKVVVRTYSVLRAVRIETFLVEFVEK
ncbi:leucine-rich repeat protein [Mycoplasmatota bacterium WC44]